MLKLKKSGLLTDTINYLGRVIRPKNLKNLSCTTDSIRGLKVPTGLTELRSFLWLRNVLTFSSQLWKKDGTLMYKNLERPAVNVWNSEHWRAQVYAVTIECAYISACPLISQLKRSRHIRHRRLGCLRWLRSSMRLAWLKENRSS